MHRPMKGTLKLAAVTCLIGALASCGDDDAEDVSTQTANSAQPTDEPQPDTTVASDESVASDVSVAVEPNSAGPQPCEGAKVTVNYDADLVKNGLGCRPTPTQQIDVLISASEPNPAQICTKMDGWLRPAVAGDALGGWVCEYADPELLR